MMIGKLGMAYLGVTDTDSTDPGVANVLEDVDYVIDGAAKTGVYRPALAADVKYGISFGPNGSLIGNFPPLISGTSFTSVIANLKAVLETDPFLQAYAQSKWSKNIQVLTVFKQRTEVGLDDLPVIMLTRPGVDVEQENNVAYERKNTVKLYIGFKEEDRMLAQAEIIEIEELIEKALVQNPTISGMVDNIAPGNSANNEGYFHPVYFIVKEFLVLKEDVWR